MLVIKRNGQKVEFDFLKIQNAIKGANQEVNEEDKIDSVNLHIIVSNVTDKCAALGRAVGVEEIQDFVEEELCNQGYIEVARKYIRYRYLHSMVRDRYEDFMEAISEKLSASNVQNQNANVDERSFGGRQGEAQRLVNKQYALDYLVSKMARDNHLNNEIYIHDLDSYAVGSHNCLSIPFDDLLANGFNTRQTDVRPANSINTAFQLVAVIFQLQSLQQFGGVSATHLDWTMVPYVRKSFWKHYTEGFKCFENATDCIYTLGIDTSRMPIESYHNPTVDDDVLSLVYEATMDKKVYKYALEQTEKELQQAVEGMYHNLNTLQSRSGNQLPFTSVNYGTCPLPEGRMVTKALLEGSLKGVGKFHKTPIFPCGIFQCMKGVNRKPGEPNYDLFQLALKSTAQRLYPNYANVDWSGNTGYDRNDPRTYFSTINKPVVCYSNIV